jgi:UDP-N-acetylmuramate-alanine ligase
MIAFDFYNIEVDAFATFFDEFSSRYSMVTNLSLMDFDEHDSYELIETRFRQLFTNVKSVMGQIDRKGDNKTLRLQIMKNNAEMAALCYVMYQVSYKKSMFGQP